MNKNNKDYFLAVSSTPKKFFEAAIKDLSSSIRKEREIAFATIHVLASEGSHEYSSECKYFVGECCYYGRGIKKDPERAIRWFQSVLPNIWPQGLLPTPNNAMVLYNYFYVHFNYVSLIIHFFSSRFIYIPPPPFYLFIYLFVVYLYYV